ncbi:hypothetical protein E2C01_071050 [Portunus trituberculatus]|uniref:Uncharacterized protein n=1 Tax=Portunus trituberculatus TaxID=210409 RepID=A0A5B7I308_PORTR|nr:hypothetical protein [Portunus trituberculatus]
MRMYHSLRSSGFGVRNKRTIYKPCKMILKFHDPTCLDETASTCGSNSSLLLAEVIPIQSIYQGKCWVGRWPGRRKGRLKVFFYSSSRRGVMGEKIN